MDIKQMVDVLRQVKELELTNQTYGAKTEKAIVV
jgi:hypothetical protein